MIATTQSIFLEQIASIEHRENIAFQKIGKLPSRKSDSRRAKRKQQDQQRKHESRKAERERFAFQ